MAIRRLWSDQTGGALVEATVLIPILFVFLLGSVDFLYAFYQWTAATKAMEVGARLAAVSDPVATGLTGTSNVAVSAAVPIGSAQVGDAMPDFQITCASSACTCTRGTCTGMGSYSATAMNTIVFGRGSSACGDATSSYNAGMCDIFPRITAANVKIVYDQTGLGYAGRKAGPVPTIAVSLQNMNFQFFFLNGLMGFANLAMPKFTATVTGEGMSSAAQ
ncbi:TadE/TadG family type IV pilus assembly protein [Bradyrhizobium sp. BWC-3-1]|uniref:TadE/TadG family type IV pilus assembly protein n=1 Tax=Bradyrhizobium sp. BWC-3-1 TaxID=3080012 RepID=UPI00293F44B8|nr:TadE/TadG family type IV pilus assembly protein [Bradyrhizobium sp. BWC-3-1]WOH56041.1 TadE/TadG family type IV pilus assembly protein [Bradyrhizobium sp. BWC-3-1]